MDAYSVRLLRIPAGILICFFAGSGTSVPRTEASSCDLMQVPYCTWAWSNDGFFTVNDIVSLINFETLPDGAPSFGGAAITPAFNYALQGALFTPALPSQFLTGNSQVGYALMAYASSITSHNSITAQLTNPERGIGVWVVGHTTLLAFDAQGSLITGVSYNSPFDVKYFLGIKSNTPIARVEIDRGTNVATLDDFTMIHIPVPEPASAGLLLLAAPVLLRRPGRWKQRGLKGD